MPLWTNRPLWMPWTSLENTGTKNTRKFSQSWRDNWANLSTYFKYPQEVRRLIYTTNTIEGFNRQLRKVTKAKSVFPTDDSLLKMLYLAMMDITKKWTGRRQDWSLNPCTDGDLLRRAYARVTPLCLDVKGQMNGFAALDIHPHRRYVIDIGGRRSSRCRLHINFALFLHSLDFTQNLGLTPVIYSAMLGSRALPFLGRHLGLGGIPTASFFCFRLYRERNHAFPYV